MSISEQTERDISRTAMSAREIGARFNRIASSYDLLTSLNPGYRAHLRRSVERLGLPRRGGGASLRLLDLCCGTGVSTEELVAVYPRAEIVALDASEEMLARARTKPALRDVRFVLGDATDFSAHGVEGKFDGVLMAYGIRNIPDRDRALASVLAALADGAPAVFHEYSVNDSMLRTRVWDAVCFGVIVPFGALTAGSGDIYRYLHRSVRAFDGARAFEARLARAGFVDVWTGAMDGWQRSIVHSFVGRKPRAADSERVR